MAATANLRYAPDFRVSINDAPALARADVGTARLAAIVERDSAMSVKVLQLVNSPYFGLSQRVVSIQQAVGLLGVDRLDVAREHLDRGQEAQIFEVERAHGADHASEVGDQRRRHRAHQSPDRTGAPRHRDGGVGRGRGAEQPGRHARACRETGRRGQLLPWGTGTPTRFHALAHQPRPHTCKQLTDQRGRQPLCRSHPAWRQPACGTRPALAECG